MGSQVRQGQSNWWGCISVETESNTQTANIKNLEFQNFLKSSVSLHLCVCQWQLIWRYDFKFKIPFPQLNIGHVLKHYACHPAAGGNTHAPTYLVSYLTADQNYTGVIKQVVIERQTIEQKASGTLLPEEAANNIIKKIIISLKSFRKDYTHKLVKGEVE